MRTALFISSILLYGLLMMFNLGNCHEPGKRSEPGERMAPTYFEDKGGVKYDSSAMKRYFQNMNRDPFKVPGHIPDVKKMVPGR